MIAMRKKPENKQPGINAETSKNQESHCPDSQMNNSMGPSKATRRVFSTMRHQATKIQALFAMQGLSHPRSFFHIHSSLFVLASCIFRNTTGKTCKYLQIPTLCPPSQASNSQQGIITLPTSLDGGLWMHIDEACMACFNLEASKGRSKTAKKNQRGKHSFVNPQYFHSPPPRRDSWGGDVGHWCTCVICKRLRAQCLVSSRRAKDPCLKSWYLTE